MVVERLDDAGLVDILYETFRLAQPEPAEGEGRVCECKWEAATSFKIPADWPSGVYLGKLTTEREGYQSYVIFVVRDERPCDLLFQVVFHAKIAEDRGLFSFNDVADAIADGVAPQATGRDGLVVTAMIEATLLSLREHRPVRMSDVLEIGN